MACLLVIDAQGAARDALCKKLQAGEHRVCTMDSGIGAVAWLEQNHADLILLGMKLPDLDGYEMTLRLRGISELDVVPIVILTENAEDRACLAVGADAIVAPTLSEQALKSTVQALLQSEQTARLGRPETLRLRSQQIVRHLEEKVIALSEANRRLEEFARLRREFLRNITHELATPLTPVIGYLRLLLDGQLGELSALQHKSLNAMNASAERLRFLIDTLLDMSHLESGRMHFYARRYDFAEVIQRVISGAAARAEDRDVRIISSIPKAALSARGDSDKLARAAVHVLDNAIKFSPPGGKVAIAVRQNQHAEHGDSYLLQVADSGPGVAGDQLERIFEPFFQADGSPTRTYGGVGLGMAFVRRVSRGMGGEVSIVSPPNQAVAGLRLSGTLVTIEIPAQAPATQFQSTPSALDNEPAGGSQRTSDASSTQPSNRNDAGNPPKSATDGTP